MAPCVALSRITRTMAAHSMLASSRQASTAELTSRGPLELPWGSVGYRSGCGLPELQAAWTAACSPRRLMRTGGPHASTASTCSSRSAKSVAATCDAGLLCRVTQAGNTLRLRQQRIKGPRSMQAELPQASPARSSPPLPPHAARRGDLEGKECLPIGLRPRQSRLCADRAGRPLPRTGGHALGSALIHADHGPPFCAAGGQQTGQHSGINEPRAADRKPHGPCGLRGLVRQTVVFVRGTGLQQLL